MNASRWIAVAALVAMLTAPAGAQVVTSEQSTDIGVTPGAPLTFQPSVTTHAPQLTPEQLDRSNWAEDPAITSSAKNAYAALASGSVNRLKLTDALAGAFTPAIVKSFGAQLQSLGTPAWHFVENAHAYSGAVSIYRLDYASGTGYVTFGIADDGIVYALSFANTLPK